jgi:hypothetical protein
VSDGESDPDSQPQLNQRARRGERIVGRSLRLAVVVLGAFVAWLVVGAVVGTPGPGWLRRYSVADLRAGEAALEDEYDVQFGLCVWDLEVAIDPITARVVLGRPPYEDPVVERRWREELDAWLRSRDIAPDMIAFTSGRGSSAVACSAPD